MARKLKHELLQVVHERYPLEQLFGRIEIDDDACPSSERSGKRGRGAERKFPFVAAAQTDEEGHPMPVSADG